VASKGFIYVALNESMPGLLKIGRSKNHPEQRMQELAGTGVPTPFQLAYLAMVEDHEASELQLHQLFSESRVNQNREFFKLDTLVAMRKIREVLSPLYEEVDDDLVDAPDFDPLYTEVDNSTHAPEPDLASPEITASKETLPRSVAIAIDKGYREAMDEIAVLTKAAKQRLQDD
jgi:hypothetical protein